MTIFSKVFIINYLFCFITRLNSDVFLARITLLWTLWVWFKMQVLRYLSKPYFLPSTDQYYETLQPQPTAAEVCFYDPHVYPFLGADWESLSLSCWKTEKKWQKQKYCWNDWVLWFLLTGLQDNPWACDCSLYEMVHFLNFQSPNIAFIEPRLKCFTPRSLAGVFFSQVELRKCQSPVVHTSVAKVKTILGSTVLLRCGTTGVPIPELSWRRADGAPLNGTGTFKLKLFFSPV